MPIINKIKKKNLEIGIWKIDETSQELHRLDKLNYRTDGLSEKNKKEFLASRILASKFISNYKIKYDKYGGPIINNNVHISISHTNELASTIISNKKVGLDIEKISEKALKVQSKFINKIHTDLNNEKATLLWCCKRAIFKWHRKGRVNFLNDIVIHPFSMKNHGEILANFLGNEITLNFLKINKHFLVYVCK